MLSCTEPIPGDFGHDTLNRVPINHRAHNSHSHIADNLGMSISLICTCFLYILFSISGALFKLHCSDWWWGRNAISLISAKLYTRADTTSHKSAYDAMLFTVVLWLDKQCHHRTVPASLHSVTFLHCNGPTSSINMAAVPLQCCLLSPSER